MTATVIGALLVAALLAWAVAVFNRLVRFQADDGSRQATPVELAR